MCFDKVEKFNSVTCPNVNCTGLVCAAEMNVETKVECRKCCLKAKWQTVLQASDTVTIYYEVYLGAAPYKLLSELIPETNDTVDFLVSNRFNFEANDLSIDALEVVAETATVE